MTDCFSQKPNFGFKPQDIHEAKAAGELLSVEIEFSLSCNFKCPYCYEPNINDLNNELTRSEIKDVIVQAQGLGAKKIIILGGEPMIYPYLFEMLDYITERGLQIQMFTNGCDISAENARRLFQYNVDVVLKMNSFNAAIQDQLSGCEGAFGVIQSAYENLHAAGYPAKKPFLAVSTVICRQNISEIETIWRWARDRKVEPYVEMITPQGNAFDNDWLQVSSEEARTVFESIQTIDRQEYGYEWEAQPPLVGNKCLRHHFSCLVNAKGDVLPCVGVTVPLGNIRKQKLRQILEDSEVIDNLRKHDTMIKGPCRVCEKADECYGCRGAAYQLTGDYLASDPLCWFNSNKQDEITKLPIDVGPFIPQKKRMRMIDRLLAIGERTAEIEVTVREECLFVNDQGQLESSAVLELIAQSAAAMNGFLSYDGIHIDRIEHKGFLLGARDVEMHATITVGDVLHVLVRKLEKYGDFGVIEGRVFRGDELVAHGEVTVYHQNSDMVAHSDS